MWPGCHEEYLPWQGISLLPNKLPMGNIDRQRANGRRNYTRGHLRAIQPGQPQEQMFRPTLFPSI